MGGGSRLRSVYYIRNLGLGLEAFPWPVRLQQVVAESCNPCAFCSELCMHHQPVSPVSGRPCHRPEPAPLACTARTAPADPVCRWASDDERHQPWVCGNGTSDPSRAHGASDRPEPFRAGVEASPQPWRSCRRVRGPGRPRVVRVRSIASVGSSVSTSTGFCRPPPTPRLSHPRPQAAASADSVRPASRRPAPQAPPPPGEPRSSPRARAGSRPTDVKRRSLPTAFAVADM
jgi:hypothetical protein